MRSATLMDDADFVLSAFSQAETEKLQELIKKSYTTLIDDFVKGTLDSTSHTL
jgi:peptidyl-tRNA hydrolase